MTGRWRRGATRSRELPARALSGGGASGTGSPPSGPNRYVANSRTTQARIRAYFGREARVVYPPVETARFTPGPVGDHYVVVSELMAHKQIDEAVAAFNHVRLPLIVIGDGPAAAVAATDGRPDGHLRGPAARRDRRRRSCRTRER